MPESEDLRQIIVIRKDLPMTAGKMVAQGAHASMAVLLDYPAQGWRAWLVKKLCPELFLLEFPLDLQTWLSGKFTKIAVRVESEAELVSVFEKASAAGLPCKMITDAGLTAFKGVPTRTCCAIGPASRSALDPITGGLKLL